MKIEKEEFTLPLFPDNTILYLEDPVEFTGKLWDLMNTCGFQIQHQYLKSSLHLCQQCILGNVRQSTWLHQNQVSRDICNQRKERSLQWKHWTLTQKITEEGVRGWEDTPCSWTGRVNVVKMPTVPTLIFRFNPILWRLWHIPSFEKERQELTCNDKTMSSQQPAAAPLPNSHFTAKL